MYTWEIDPKNKYTLHIVINGEYTGLSIILQDDISYNVYFRNKIFKKIDRNILSGFCRKLLENYD